MAVCYWCSISFSGHPVPVWKLAAQLVVVLLVAGWGEGCFKHGGWHQILTLVERHDVFV